MKVTRLAIHDLTVYNGDVVCGNGLPFDRVGYSRFKYGYTPPGRQYGHELAVILTNQLNDQRGLGDGRPIRIVSAPYRSVPTASHVIASSLSIELGLSAIRRGLEPPSVLRFYKAQIGESSYAQGSLETRRSMVPSLGLHIDTSLVKDCHLLVVDDIRITGTAEQATAAYVEPLHPASVWYLHAARLDEAVSKTHPGLEDELNQTVQHPLADIVRDSREGNFQLNTRVLRHILEADNESLFDAFVLTAPRWLLSEILETAVGNGLAYFTKYRESLLKIEAYLRP